MNEKQQNFYGWTIVALVVYCLAFTSGIHFFSLPVYIPSLVSYFETTTTKLMISVPIGQIFFGISSPLLGRVIGRLGVKKVFVAGILLASLTNLLFSFATELWHFYLVAALNGISMAATTFLPCQTIISIWFNKKRGTAMGIGMVGLGLGGFIFPQVAAYLIQYFSEWVHEVDTYRTIPLSLELLASQGEGLNAWRAPFRLASLGYIILLLPPILLLMKNHPSEAGQNVDGDFSVEEDNQESLVEIPLKEAMKLPTFWLLFAFMLLQIFFVAGIELNLPTFASKEAGYTLLSSAQFVAFGFLVSIPMRFVMGYLCDRYNPKWLVLFAGFGYALSAGTLIVLILGNGWNGNIPIYIFAFIFGTSLAANEVGLPIYIGRCFGSRHFPEIMGQMLIGAAIGAFFGPVLISLLYDMQESYESALWVLLFIGVISSSLIIPTCSHQE